MGLNLTPTSSTTEKLALEKSSKDYSEKYAEVSREAALAYPHQYTAEQVLQALSSHSDRGLSTNEARARLEQYGRNELKGNGSRVPIIPIFVHQIANAMTFVLIIAMVVSLAIQSWIEGGVLAGVVAINIFVGFSQEYAAEKTMSSLRSLASPTAVVLRDGQTVTVDAAEVVPGDIIILSLGDTVPADARLLEAHSLETDEAALTGESLPVLKEAEKVFSETEDVGVGDRLNMIHSSSSVCKGRGKAVVTSTAMHTEIGRIAEALQRKASDSHGRPIPRGAGRRRPHHYIKAGAMTVGRRVLLFLGLIGGTPLQLLLSRMALLLLALAVVFALIVLASNNWTDREVILYAVATGVSMIPASLTAVLTIIMAMGGRAMARHDVVVRKLPALEALGAVTDICADKTGTLTQGRMIVKKAWLPTTGELHVSETAESFNPTLGSVSRVQDGQETIVAIDGKAQAELNNELVSLRDSLLVASLCNTARVWKNEESVWEAQGNPTECALQVWAQRFELGRDQLMAPTEEGDSKRGSWRLQNEYPFDSNVKRMTVTLFDTATSTSRAMMKGAVEQILPACTAIQTDSGSKTLTEDDKQQVLSRVDALSSEGLRVLALAHRPLSERECEAGESLARDEVEARMTLLGLVGLYDPPRAASRGAVKACHSAGIEVHMLTGDHPGTARAIAGQVGILPPGDIPEHLVMTAAQFDKLSDDEIDALKKLPLVIARCAPQTKVRMIEALHRRNRLCAMTGDGVNDAPSLQLADIGLAMGQAGSDVAKDVSDMVLMKDDFASMERAIAEGRRMLQNIRKVVLHLLAQNVAQACVLLIGLAFKDETGLSVFPLSPVEILYVIMVTSGLPAMGLGFEAASVDVMRQRPPKSPLRGVLNMETVVDVLVYGTFVAGLCLAAFTLPMYAWENGDLGLDCNRGYSDSCEAVFRARGTTFVVLSWCSLLLAWEVCDLRRSFFRRGEDARWYNQWFVDAWRNKFLFACVVLGFLSVIPLLFIPGLNHVVFLHKAPLGWEWGVAVAGTVLFMLFVEAWKAAKRVWARNERSSSAAGDDAYTNETGSDFSSPDSA